MTESMLRADASGIIRPEEVGQLVVQPVGKTSVAMQVATVVFTDSAEYRIPVVENDVAAAWTPEGDEIDASNAGIGEVVVAPKKLAALTVISNELASDSSPEAAAIVGESIARDIARKIDAAFFGDTTANGPDGIESIGGAQEVGAVFDNIDAFHEAVAKAENVGADITAWVANASTVLRLSKLKVGDTWNLPLLQPDPTLPTRRQVLGRPLFAVPDTVLGDDVVWGIDRSRAFVVIREDVTLAVDASAYFSSDQLAVRATMRVGFGFPHEAALVRIGDTGS